MDPARLLLFLLLGLNGLQHVARLGNMREIDFGRDGLGSAGGRRTHMTGRPRYMLKMSAHLLGFIGLQ
jgi:hypothetical protein